MLEKLKNIKIDSNYTGIIKYGGKPRIDGKKLIRLEDLKTANKNISSKNESEGSEIQESSNNNNIENKAEKTREGSKGSSKKQSGIIGMIDEFMNSIFGFDNNSKSNTSKKKASDNKESSKKSDKNNKNTNNNSNKNSKDKESLDEEMKRIIRLDDDEYSDKLLSNELRKYVIEYEKNYISALADYKTHISPSYWEVKNNELNISGVAAKTYYANNYPSYIDFLWTRDLLSFYGKWDISWYIYPADESIIQTVLRRKATQLKAEISDSQQKGITLDSEVEIEYRDVNSIREKLATREERYFETSFYATIYNEDSEKLSEESKKFEQKISGYGVRMKPASFRMDEGFNSIIPICNDELSISRSMVSTSLGGAFPFITNDLIENSGILYGVNLHTGSLVIFDRFSNRLPNSNSVVLATSGAGKSFTVKLEILRYLLSGIDIVVIDPENEYKGLIEKVGGSYVNISINSQHHINPFDLPPKIEDVEYGKGDLLRSQIMNLIGLISVLIGGISPQEEAILDKAIKAAYELKEITLDRDDYEGLKPPTMEDLLNMLEGMEGGNDMALKLSKYVTGTFGKLFNNETNIDLDTGLTVFSIRDLDDALKTPCMFNVLNYIWTKVRSKKQRRLLVVDEAWIMMQHDVSANFLFGLIKRARKYGLGVTTISQDVEDFIKSKYGKPIVSNSSIQILLKQSTVSIKSLDTVFGLSDAEKDKLVSSSVGEGLFFAGNNHVALKILASPHERDFITTDVK